MPDNEPGPEESEEAASGKRGEQSDPSEHENKDDQKDDWNLAVRFRDIQRYGYLEPKKRQELTERGVQAVLDQATQSLGPVSKPFLTRTLDEAALLQTDSVHHEIDIEETLFANTGRTGESPQLLYQVRLTREHPVILLLDTSLSMKGEKVAILAVTVAALAQVVPADKLCVLGFDSEIHVIKEFNESTALKTVVERTLSIPPGGFTNITLGLEAARTRLDRSTQGQARIILVSDGRYTEGKDPTQEARSFRFTYPFKLGKDPTGRAIMKEISDTGQGKFTEVREMKDLPRILLHAIRSWVR